MYKEHSSHKTVNKLNKFPLSTCQLFCWNLREALLYNDVPMEIVSKLLGHSSMKITQDSYGKVVEKKISEEMSRLMSKKEKTT